MMLLLCVHIYWNVRAGKEVQKSDEIKQNIFMKRWKKHSLTHTRTHRKTYQIFKSMEEMKNIIQRRLSAYFFTEKFHQKME